MEFTHENWEIELEIDDYYPLVMTNIAMGNGPFIDGLPNLKMMDLSMANC